jgi:hypothetical protein
MRLLPCPTEDHGYDGGGLEAIIQERRNILRDLAGEVADLEISSVEESDSILIVGIPWLPDETNLLPNLAAGNDLLSVRAIRVTLGFTNNVIADDVRPIVSR